MSNDRRSNNEIVKPDSAPNERVKELSRFLQARERVLADYCGKTLNPATLIRLACYEFAKQEYLQRATPASIYAALITSAQLGLEPSGVRGEAYLVPFKGECTLIPGYRGLIKLAMQSTMVKSIDAQLVYEADHFEVWLGTDVRIVHRPDFTSDNGGGIIAAYAVAELSTGGKVVEVMGRGELEHIKAFAASQRKGQPGPAYDQWEDQMFRKAPIRRLCKRLPLGDKFAMAAHVDDSGGDPAKIRAVIDLPTDASFDVGDPDPTPEQKAQLSDRVAERAAQTRGQQ